MVPDLPVDIYGVIAEFLAGAFAFATLANLNVANQGIREVTTPVLYETFLLDREVDWERFRSGEISGRHAAFYQDLPSRSSLKYTKYCVRVRVQENLRPPDIGLELPNIVATLIVNRRLWPERGQPITMLLHQPVTTFTLLGVICKCPVRTMETPEYQDRRPQGVFDFVVEPVGAVQDVLLDGDGRLLSVTQPWTTSVRVDNEYPMDEILESSESILELLALAGRRSITGCRRGKNTGRILGCGLSYDTERDAFLVKSLKGLSEMEFRLEPHEFTQFLDLFFATAMENPVILGNQIRIEIKPSEEYPNHAQIMAAIPDMEHRVLLLNTRLNHVENTGDLSALDLPERDTHSSEQTVVELAVQCRFEYHFQQELWFISEVFETSALPGRPNEIIVAGSPFQQLDMSLQDFLDMLRDEWAP